MDSPLASANKTLAAHAELTARIRASQQEHRRILSTLPSPPQSLLSLPLLPSPPPSPPVSPSPPPPVNLPRKQANGLLPNQKAVRPDLPPAKRARVARYANYVPEEETIRNDYSQRYVDGGEWPQNWVQGAEPERRFEEYPKQQRLLALKKAAVLESVNPPMHALQSSLTTLQPAKFDVILIDPPFSSSFSWDALQVLPIPFLAADPSFVFLWVGSGAGEGLEKGREVLAKWGYRRCEDVVWIKTNKTTNKGPGTDPPTTSLLTRTKQHCLMGIRGTVRRSTDNWFVHCNVDTDVILWEGDPTDPTRKPPEMYTLIENFCLGTRRLEIFGRAHSLRKGWVTAGDFDLTQDMMNEIGARPWNKDTWENETRNPAMGKPLVSMNQEIENLRPKSPVRGGASNNSPAVQQHQHQGGMGQGPGISLPSRPHGGPSTMVSGNMNRPVIGGAISGGVPMGLGIMGMHQPQPHMNQQRQQNFHQQQQPQQFQQPGMMGMNTGMGGGIPGMAMGMQNPMVGMNMNMNPMNVGMGMGGTGGMMLGGGGQGSFGGFGQPQQNFNPQMMGLGMGIGGMPGMQPSPQMQTQMQMQMGMRGMGMQMMPMMGMNPSGGGAGGGWEMNPNAQPFVPGSGYQGNQRNMGMGMGPGGAAFPHQQGGWSG